VPPEPYPCSISLITATNWVYTGIVFGTTIATPGGFSASTTLAADVVWYAYVVTSVDINGQESAPSSYISFGPFKDIRVTAGTNTISWLPVTGAVSYNVYRANPSYNNPVPGGSVFGFIGNVQGTTIFDSNIGPDFSSGPPIVQNPFSGAGSVATIYLTASGTYTAVPTVTLTASPGVTATASSVTSM